MATAVAREALPPPPQGKVELKLLEADYSAC